MALKRESKVSVTPTKRTKQFWKNQKERPIGQDMTEEDMDAWWRALSAAYQSIKTQPKKPKPLPKKPTVTVTVKKVGPPRPFTDVEEAEAAQRLRKAAAEKKFEKLVKLKESFKNKP
jgi:hypothetical protein